MLGYQIRLLRVEKGWSQERLAHESGFDRTYVSGVERSAWNVALENIGRFAQALGVEPWTLLQPPPDSKPTPRRRLASTVREEPSRAKARSPKSSA
ncbi:helix-turn-helix domain-containing protein [Acidovorax sp. NPDC077693]|uniref:helix-turn-helix domain-containing protein n=1 Tax=Acidovorax sp. NPDC077693 TaxID=3363889 RepID=UPI0037C71D79